MNESLRATPFSNLPFLVQTLNFSAVKVTDYTLESLKVSQSGDPLYNSNQSYYGFTIDEMLVSCNYLGSTCSTSDFTLYKSYDYGNCYKFNGGSNSSIKKVSSAGPGNSFTVELFSGDPTEETYVYQRGFYVIVHNQSYSPIMDYEGVYVSTNAATNVGIERNYYSKQPSPYSQCIVNTTSNSSSTSTLYQLILNQLGEQRYRRAYCYKLCYQIAVVNNCSCYDATYPNTNTTNQNIQACHTGIQLSCRDGVVTWFSTNGFISTCDSYCPVECLAVDYKKSIHSAFYPTSAYLSLLKQQSGFLSKYTTATQNSANFDSYIGSSISKINIFYNDISFIAYIESPSITWDTLVGNIGGILGLFIGISIMSIMEILEFIFEIIKIVYDHNKEVNRIDSSQLNSLVL